MKNCKTFYKAQKTRRINEITQPFYLDPSLFSPTLIVFLMMFCVRLLSELMIMDNALKSSHDKTSDLSQQVVI